MDVIRTHLTGDSPSPCLDSATAQSAQSRGRVARAAAAVRLPADELVGGQRCASYNSTLLS